MRRTRVQPLGVNRKSPLWVCSDTLSQDIYLLLSYRAGIYPESSHSLERFFSCLLQNQFLWHIITGMKWKLYQSVLLSSQKDIRSCWVGNLMLMICRSMSVLFLISQRRICGNYGMALGDKKKVKKHPFRAPGWCSHLSVGLLLSAQIMISRLWDWGLH